MIVYNNFKQSKANVYALKANAINGTETIYIGTNIYIKIKLLHAWDIDSQS